MQEGPIIKEIKLNLEKNPIVKRDGDDISVWLRSEDVYIYFLLKSVTYVGRELNCTLVCTPTDVTETYISYTVRINLLSQSSRELLARALKNSFRRLEVNWGLCLNQLCTKVEGFLNSEEKIYDLTEVEPEETSYLLYPFITKNQPNMLFGKGGTGKSSLSLLFALSVARGIASPFLEYMSPEKTNVLFVDYESTRHIFSKRLKKIDSSYSDKGSILYRDTHEPLCDIADSVREEIRKRGIGLVIVDSAALACGGKPEDAESALNFFHALKRINCTSLVIAHETKTENKSYPFGSVFFFNSFRNIWNAQSKQEDLGKKVLNIGLFHRKSNEDMLHTPKGIRVYFGESTEFSGGTTDLWEQEQTLSSRVYRLLKEGDPRTPKQVADELGENRGSIRKIVERMREKGTIRKDGGLYGLENKKGVENGKEIDSNSLF